MVKNAKKGGASVQRTFRTAVEDFSWSPDGTTLCFTEVRNGHHGIYLVNAEQGSVVKQISGGNDNDYGGVLSRDGNTISSTVERDFSHTAYGAMTARPTFFPTILVA